MMLMMLMLMLMMLMLMMLMMLILPPEAIIRTFHYMGFEMVKPGNPVVPPRPDLVSMAYPLEASSSDEE